MIMNPTRPWWAGLRLVAGYAAVILATAGCGQGVKTVPVVGSVTFNGNPPAHPCFVNFLPTGIELPTGPSKGGVQGLAGGVGECDAAGAFAVICLRHRNGLMPGRYEVLISCCLPNKNPNAPPVSVVPAGFKAPELVVPADARSVRYDVDVPAPSRKPSG